MYDVDALSAMLARPQAEIFAVGSIADHVAQAPRGWAISHM
jgi:hypothetical protein